MALRGTNTERQVIEKVATLTYLDNGKVIELFTLPANAHIMRFMVDVETAFDDTGTDLLDIGKIGSGEFFAADVTLAVATQVIVEQYELGDVGNRLITVTGTYAGQNSNATAGKAHIYCFYSTKYGRK